MTTDMLTAITALGVAAIGGGFSYVTARRMASTSRVDAMDQRLQDCEERCSKHLNDITVTCKELDVIRKELHREERKHFELLMEMRELQKKIMG